MTPVAERALRMALTYPCASDVHELIEIALLAEPRRRTSWAVTKKLRRLVIERDGLSCRLCGAPVELGDVHIDHKRPVVLGGTNALNNLQVTHSTCNLRKGGRS